MTNKNKTVCVVVLGDIGRSPRMQYHALSLAQCDFKVDLVGYQDSMPLSDIVENNKIKITELTPLPSFKAPRLFQYILKVFWQIINLFLILASVGRKDFVLCQNPPAIPTLFVCWIYCLFARSKLVIDWHNYAFSIMALSHGKNSLIIKLAKYLEFSFGSLATANLCVTRAMKDDLLKHNIVARVLYDRPAEMFHPITDKEKHDFFSKMAYDYPQFKLIDKSKLNHPTTDMGLEKNVMTEWDGHTVKYREQRPGILFSSTSWTPDEDFQILLSALDNYNRESLLNNSFPKLLCIITGKGPMKDYYIDIIREKNFHNVEIITPWLEAKDYPVMVASADLGVCLHTSSSGLDLPMKVVDMFGSGLPVCAFKYNCLDELVKDGENGFTFENSKDLSQKILQWFGGFPNNIQQNDINRKFQKNLESFYTQKWHKNWENRAKRIFS